MEGTGWEDQEDREGRKRMVAGKIKQRPMEPLMVVCKFEDHLRHFEPDLTEVCRPRDHLRQRAAEGGVWRERLREGAGEKGRERLREGAGSKDRERLKAGAGCEG